MKGEFNVEDHVHEVSELVLPLQELISPLLRKHGPAVTADALLIQVAAISVATTARLAPVEDKEESVQGLFDAMNEAMKKFCRELAGMEEDHV